MLQKHLLEIKFLATIYKINLKFIDLLPMMEYIENYDSSLNIVKDDYVSIVDNEMFDCLPFIEY